MGANCCRQNNDPYQTKLEKQIGCRIQRFYTPDLNNNIYSKAIFYKQKDTDILWKVHTSPSTFNHYNHIYRLEGGENYLMKPHMNIQLDNLLYATSMDLGRGDMFTLLQSPFKSKYVQKLLINIAKGIHWLHQHDIAHHDIKLENIIIIDNMAKLSDFDFTTLANIKHTRGGTPGYVPTKIPDNISNKGKRSDIYAFGKILCVVFLRSIEKKYIKYSDIPFVKKLFEDDFTRPHYKHKLTDSWKLWADICLQCCAKIPPDRIPLIDTLETVNILNI